MGKRLTIDFVQKAFEKEGYILLSKEYVNSKIPLEYICPENHSGSIMWNCWQRGNRCDECGGTKKLTIDFIKKEFKKEGYELLTKIYKSAHQELKYICPRGHKWSIQWYSWKQGHRCFKCRYENNCKENNPRWNLNLTDEDRENGRNIQGYDDWRFAVYKKDNNTCQACGKKKSIVKNAHHLESYNNNLDLRIALDNGVCLCENCHKAFHRQYGRGNNTKEQFKEFVLNLQYVDCIGDLKSG
jgi:5-methylcytosine-specific restriction endonuclease McrA